MSEIVQKVFTKLQKKNSEIRLAEIFERHSCRKSQRISNLDLRHPIKIVVLK